MITKNQIGRKNEKEVRGRRSVPDVCVGPGPSPRLQMGAACRGRSYSRQEARPPEQTRRVSPRGSQNWGTTAREAVMPRSQESKNVREESEREIHVGFSKWEDAGAPRSSPGAQAPCLFVLCWWLCLRAKQLYQGDTGRRRSGRSLSGGW